VVPPPREEERGKSPQRNEKKDRFSGGQGWKKRWKRSRMTGRPKDGRVKSPATGVFIRWETTNGSRKKKVFVGRRGRPKREETFHQKGAARGGIKETKHSFRGLTGPKSHIGVRNVPHRKSPSIKKKQGNARPPLARSPERGKRKKGAQDVPLEGRCTGGGEDGFVVVGLTGRWAGKGNGYWGVGGGHGEVPRQASDNSWWGGNRGSSFLFTTYPSKGRRKRWTAWSCTGGEGRGRKKKRNPQAEVKKKKQTLEEEKSRWVQPTRQR